MTRTVETPTARVCVRLTSQPLDLAAAHAQVSDPACGAIGLFSGTVRDHHEGESVEGLDYEAWEERAEDVMLAVASDVAEEFPEVRAIFVAHRVGSLAIGDVAVVCATSAPHRREALDAASALIERVKQRVPIWKRERLTDGRVRWVGAPDLPPDAPANPREGTSGGG